MLLSLPALLWSEDVGTVPASHLRAGCEQCRWVCSWVPFPCFSKLLLWLGSQWGSGQLKTVHVWAQLKGWVWSAYVAGLLVAQVVAECRLSGKELLFIPVSILKEIREQDDVNDGCLGLEIAWQEM